jgi:WD40 repeat protein
VGARSILVDGTPVGRTGHVVTGVEPLDDNRRAWILASTFRRSYEPSWGVLEWSLDDGRIVTLREGRGRALGIAPRGGRVFIGGHSWETRWEDVDGGASGAVPLDGGHEPVTCSPEGRHLLTWRAGERRINWARIRPVEGDGEAFPEVPAPLVFSDDGRFAVHFGEDGVSLRWFSLQDRATASVEIGASTAGWLGVRAVRGAPRMMVWDADQIVICDLAAQRIAGRAAVERFETVGDAAAQRVVLGGRRGGDPFINVLDLESGRRVQLSGKRLSAVLTPDGRRALCTPGPVLAVVDATSGAVLSAHEGHTATVRKLVWARDGAAVASRADDGRIRVLHRGAPPVVTEIEGARTGSLEVAWSPDGRRIVAVTSSEIAVADGMTGVILARFASFGKCIDSAEISTDGRRLFAASYGHGVRVVDLATGRHVMIDRDATKDLGSQLVLAGDDLFALKQERLAGPAVLAPVELVHWVRLDLAGAVKARGTWRFEGDRSSIQLCADGVAAMIAWYARGGPRLRTFDLRAPDELRHEVSIPAGATLLDTRNGRALFGEGDDLVLRDPRTGAETWRINCPRRPSLTASLSHDGNAVAVAYRDQGVEVFEHTG